MSRHKISRRSLLGLLFLDVYREPNSVDWPMDSDSYHRELLATFVLTELDYRFTGGAARLSQWPVWHRDGALCAPGAAGAAPGLAFVASEIRPEGASSSTQSGWVHFGLFLFRDYARYAWCRTEDAYYVPSVVHVLDCRTGAVALSFCVPEALRETAETEGRARRSPDRREVLCRVGRPGRLLDYGLLDGYCMRVGPEKQWNDLMGAYSGNTSDDVIRAAKWFLDAPDRPIAEAMNSDFFRWLQKIVELCGPESLAQAPQPFVEPIPMEDRKFALPGREGGVWYSVRPGAKEVIVYEADGTEHVVPACKVSFGGCRADE